MRPFASSVFLSLVVGAASQNATKCRNIPGDANWPTLESWSALNTSVSGHLIKTVPAGHVCHDPTYNAEACQALNSTWIFPWAHFDDPSGFMAAYQQNASCNPFTSKDSPCLQGNYVEYAIEVHEAGDVIAGVQFAQANNIRLVIKNTGHDYYGKSTGKGALSLWMHKLKDITFSNYTSEAYNGPAVKMGAGVQAFEAYAASQKAGLDVVGGECPTVGIAGGYTQGGGHSLISGKHGMGADQALAWEIVTANGSLVMATPTENADLYWAMSGGGGGTYGIALSLTARAYPATIIGGASFTMVSPSGSPDDDTLWEAISFFYREALPAIRNAGAHVQMIIVGPVFMLSEVTIPGATEDDMRGVMKPFTDHLDSRSIGYQMNVTSYPDFYKHADHYIGPLPYGVAYSAQIQGGVMISEDVALSNSTGPEVIAHLRHIATTTDFYILPYAFNGGAKAPSTPPNAVHAGWRDLHSYIVISHQWNYTAPFSYMEDLERKLTEEIMPPLQELASGAYLSESDFRNPKWKEEFYGANWDRLNAIKQRWDANDLFYALTAVGSDRWESDADGRLCRV
ncbi:putative isoamyl alcohol oxidase [Phaeosphaeria sp. MPI-PUGE-AT-0046c]|nr:putative isoamyl alcohol oxidase [Phaeosphaeria sp. MPI-PUGE-AT-0046c]